MSACSEFFMSRALMASQKSSRSTQGEDGIANKIGRKLGAASDASQVIWYRVNSSWDNQFTMEAGAQGGDVQSPWKPLSIVISFMDEQRRHPMIKHADLMEESQRRQSDEASRIRSDILKGEEELSNDYSSYTGLPDVSGADAISHNQQQTRGFKYHEQDSTAGIASYGNMIGQLSNSGGDYRRGGQWNSASFSDHSGKYKRMDADLGADERRVRSRTEASVLTNLLGRRDDTDLHMNISARTLRPSGGKDRHSKVFTAKGPRDRRVRLSVSTAIQFYDVQDRLGYDQPSKAVEWLMKKAKNAIDELSQIPLPGLDRMVPSSSSSMYHPFVYASTSASLCSNENADLSTVYPSHPSSATSYNSTSEMQLRGLSNLNEELESNSIGFKGSSGEQQGDENDKFPSARKRDLATVSPQLRSQVHANSLAFSPQNAMASTALQRDWKSLPQPSSSHSFLDEEQCSQPDHRHAFMQTPLQYHQQTSLITVQQTYLQQQDFLTATPALHTTPAVLPFCIPAQNAAPANHVKPYLDQFHSLKMAAERPQATPVPATTTTTTSTRFQNSFGGSASSNPELPSQRHLVGVHPMQFGSNVALEEIPESLDGEVRGNSKTGPST